MSRTLLSLIILVVLAVAGWVFFLFLPQASPRGPASGPARLEFEVAPGRPAEALVPARSADIERVPSRGQGELLVGERTDLDRSDVARGKLSASGKVVDALGRPLEDATVRVRLNGRAREVNTDEGGAFRFAELPPGEAIFDARAEGYLESTSLTLTLLADDSLESIPIVLRRGATIIVELDNTWLKGDDHVATIVPLAGTREIEGRRKSAPFDEQSLAHFRGLRAGPWRVEVRASRPGSGLASSILSVDETVELGEGEERTLRLGVPPAESVRVSGMIREGSRPLAGVRLVLVPREVSVQRALTARSGEDGGYELLLPKPGSYRITASLGHDELFMTMVEVSAGDFYFDILLEGGRISGRVETQGGRPVPFHPVRLTWVRTPGKSVIRPRFSRTDPEGNFEFIAVPEGSFRVSAGRRSGQGGEVETTVSLSPGEVLGDVALRIQATGTIEGVVVDSNGDAAEDVDVKLIPSGAIGTQRAFLTTRSSASGAFGFAGVPPGGFQIRVDKDGQRATVTLNVRVEGRHTARLRLR